MLYNWCHLLFAALYESLRMHQARTASLLAGKRFLVCFCDLGVQVSDF